MLGFLMIQNVINAEILTKMVVQRFMPQIAIGHGQILLC